MQFGEIEIKRKLELSGKWIEALEKDNRSIFELVDKLEEFSLFQDRLDFPSSIKKIWEAFIDGIKKILKIHVCALFLVDENKNNFFLKEITNEDYADLCRDELDSQVECGNLSEIIWRRKPSIIHPLVFKKDISVAILPLSTMKRTLGIVLVTTGIEKQDIINENIQLLTVLTRQCSFALENTLLNDRLRKEHECLTHAQARAVREEKVASMSRLTDGAYHNIINALNIISGNIQVLLKSNDLTPQISKHLDSMRVQSGRIDQIVKGLVHYSRNSEYEKNELDINYVIENVLSLLQYELLLDNIEVVKNLKSNLPLITGTEDQLSKVLFNFISYARDAMENGGLLEISTRIEKSTDAFISKSDFVQISIKDNGCGIEKGQMNKKLEPFFMTKETGKDTGLGLSLNYEIIQDHGGRINVESRAEKGTVFCIYLPIVNKN
ncbi:ATP-binding protein [Thermodesulfobacteriota bacterium]